MISSLVGFSLFASLQQDLLACLIRHSDSSLTWVAVAVQPAGVFGPPWHEQFEIQ